MFVKNSESVYPLKDMNMIHHYMKESDPLCCGQWDAFHFNADFSFHWNVLFSKNMKDPILESENFVIN